MNPTIYHNYNKYTSHFFLINMRFHNVEMVCEEDLNKTCRLWKLVGIPSSRLFKAEYSQHNTCKRNIVDIAKNLQLLYQ